MNRAMLLAALLFLAAAPFQAFGRGGGGGFSGGSGGGFSGGHAMSPPGGGLPRTPDSGLSAGHAVPAPGSRALQNSNGPFSADRDKGLQRAEDRRSAKGNLHEKATDHAKSRHTKRAKTPTKHAKNTVKHKS